LDARVRLEYRRRVRIERTSSFRTTVERSRFFAVAFPAAAEADVLDAVKAARGEHRKANHHCWAFRGRDAAGALVEKSKDDGEVGHPGRLLLELLKRDDLEGGLLVSRIFGGVKLGVGGVSRAFREAAEGALEGVRSP
jgi:putative IMPACT (imprinted ancient) family translation regulator